MKLLVLSDSHGDIASVLQVLRKQRETDAVLFLGDGVSDLEEVDLGGKPLIAVRGNNDWGCGEPLSQTVTLDGCKLFLTHGHAYHIKYGDEALLRAAREAGAQVLCYGHTHEAVNFYSDGLYVLNPGSLRFGGTYGLIDITPGGIMTNIVSL